MKQPLKELADKFLDSNLDEALIIAIPEELKMPNKPLYGIRDSIIRTILFIVCRTPQYPELSDEELSFVVKLKAATVFTSIHELYAQQLSAREIFRLSDDEFSLMKKAYLHIDQIYSDKYELEKAANLCKLPILINFRELLDPDFVLEQDDIFSELYLFIHDLLIGSNYELGRIVINEHMITNMERVTAVLNYLKDYTLAEQFDRSINQLQFIAAIRLICFELQLKPSIVPQRIVYMDGDECRDINEQTLEKFVMTKLNLLFSDQNVTFSNSIITTGFLDRNLSTTCVPQIACSTQVQNFFHNQALSVLNKMQEIGTQK